ncbi:hypothetical protein MSIBF_A1540024 [groundwater metagenome]|uniref:Uncharacterized protein n=1 Tax=groundwater metagenome TaxID=717931 RepID=A0A098E7Y3_9ZZZZ
MYCTSLECCGNIEGVEFTERLKLPNTIQLLFNFCFRVVSVSSFKVVVSSCFGIVSVSGFKRVVSKGSFKLFWYSFRE